MSYQLLAALYFFYDFCINFRYFTAPASKFPKPPCEIFFISNVSVTPFFAVCIININLANIFAARKNHRKFYARSVRFAQLRLGRGLSWS